MIVTVLENSGGTNCWVRALMPMKAYIRWDFIRNSCTIWQWLCQIKLFSAITIEHNSVVFVAKQ